MGTTYDAVAEAVKSLEARSAESAPAAPEPVVEAAPLEAAPHDAPEASTEPAAEPSGQPSGPARGPDGKFLPKGATTASPQGEAQAGKPTPAPEADATPATARPEETSPAAKHPAPVVSGGPAAALRPPSNWKPVAKEHWDKLPPEVKQEAVRVDIEARKALQTSADFRKAIEPHEARLKASGRDIIKDLPNILQFDAILTSGPAEAKAQMLGNLIRSAGLTDDAGLALLARQLDGGGAPAASQPAPAYDPRFDALLAQLEQAKAEKEQRAFEEFGSNHEFFDNVRDSMQKLMQAGLANSMEDAYKKACELNEDVKAVQAQRAAAKAAENAQASTQRAKAASSSVRTSSASPTASASKSGSTLDDVKAVVAGLSARR